MNAQQAAQLPTSYYYLTQSTFGIPKNEIIVDVRVTSNGIYIQTVKLS